MMFYVSERAVKVEFNEYGERDLLKGILTVELPGYRFLPAFKKSNGKWKGTISLFDSKTNTFPIGLLRVVQRKMNVPNRDIFDQRQFLNQEFFVPEYHGFEFRKYQKEAAWLAHMYKNGIIEAATNAGKTMVIVALADILHKERVLVLTHSKEIFVQLVDELKKYLAVEIGIITAEECRLAKYVNVGMISTVVNRYNTDPLIAELIDEDCNAVLVDEVHHAANKTYRSLLSNINATYRIGFSGTVPPVDSYVGMKVREYLGDVVYSIKNDDLISQGVSAVPVIKMIKFRHDINWLLLEKDIEVPEKDKNGRYYDSIEKRRIVLKKRFQKAVEQYVVQNVERNSLIVDLLVNVHPDMRFLVIVDRLEHGNNLLNMLNETNEKVRFVYGQSKTRTEDLDAFKNKECRILIATSLIDEGVNIAGVQGLVLMPGKKSRRQVLQRIGRGLRKKADDNRLLIYDVFDLDDNNFTKHSLSRYKLYKKEKFVVYLAEYKNRGICLLSQEDEKHLISSCKNKGDDDDDED